MKKFFLILLVVIVVAVVGALLARNTIATYLLEKGVKDLLGLKLTVGNIKIGVFHTDIGIDKVKVYNPAGYTEKLIAELKEIYVEYALMDIIKGFVHLPELNINIEQVNVEKNKDGALNLDCIKTTTAPAPKKEEKAAAEKEFLVNKMVLKIGTLRYIDNSQDPPVKKKIDLNYSNTFTNLSDPKVIVNSIIQEVIKQLVAQGISITVKSFLDDKEFMGALIKGDKKGMEAAAGKEVGGLGKKLEDEIFADDTDVDTGKKSKEPKITIKKKGKDKKEGLGEVLEEALEGKKKEKK